MNTMTPKITTPCFIRKNTPELCKKLEELGYKTLNSGNTTLDAHNYDGKGNHKHIDEGTAIITSYGGYYGVIYDIDDVVKEGRIDCGTNEQLFLALAALREDSDKFQWFCDDEDIENKSMFFCKYEDVEKHIHNEMDGWDCEGFHKATPEELIEHFKEK